MPKTQSLWGPPPSRYYRFLKRLRNRTQDTGEQSLAVLGCADGKFVLPAARLGFEVLAIDVDEIALFGGRKKSGDEVVWMPGLAWRLETEGLSHKVSVICADFVNYIPNRECDAALSSGAVQYSFNSHYSMEELAWAIMRHPKVGGLLYVDYMLPYEEKYKGRNNCPDAHWWKEFLKAQSRWSVMYNKVLPPTIGRAHIEYPVDHYHQWGHLLARRIA